MSQVEASAKAALEAMLAGRRLLMDASTIRAVAEWVILKMIIFEQIEKDSAVLSRADAAAFKANRTIPDGVTIWLFRARDRQFEAQIGRSFAGVSSTSNAPPLLPVHANVQAVTFGIGRLVIYFVHTTIPELNTPQFPASVANRLWPPKRSFVQWPPLKSITLQDIFMVATALRQFVRERGVLV
jgi:hypothetical protein